MVPAATATAAKRATLTCAPIACPLLSTLPPPCSCPSCIRISCRPSTETPRGCATRGCPWAAAGPGSTTTGCASAASRAILTSAICACTITWRRTPTGTFFSSAPSIPILWASTAPLPPTGSASRTPTPPISRPCRCPAASHASCAPHGEPAPSASIRSAAPSRRTAGPNRLPNRLPLLPHSIPLSPLTRRHMRWPLHQPSMLSWPLLTPPPPLSLFRSLHLIILLPDSSIGGSNRTKILPFLHPTATTTRRSPHSHPRINGSLSRSLLQNLRTHTLHLRLWLQLRLPAQSRCT